MPDADAHPPAALADQPADAGALAVPDGLELTSLGRPLRPGIDIAALDGIDAAALSRDLAWARLRGPGYLLLRGFHPRSEALAARADLVAAMAEDGLLDPERPAADSPARALERRELRRDPAAIRAMAGYLALVEGARILGLFAHLLGGPAMTLDHKWLRTVPPGRESTTRSHCDIVYMGGGTAELYTVWTPLDDISLEMGPIMLLPGSQRHQRVRDTYGRSDTHAGSPGPFSGDALETARVLGCRWASAEFRLGDILIFGMHLMHAALDNRSTRYRLSSDNRYQRADAAVDQRHMGLDIERKIRPNLAQEWLAIHGGELAR